jgi:spermidine synthase
MTRRSRCYYIDEIDRHEFHGYALWSSLYRGETKFQTVEIVESPKFGKMLILDGKIQSAALDEHIYHEALVHPAMLMHPHPRRVLILGGGEGAALREVLRYGMVQEVVMVDLDEEVVDLCRQHLPEIAGKALEDPRATLVTEDARDFLQRSDDRFDVIIQDITDAVTADFSEAYYRTIQQRLADRGILTMQALELSLSDYTGHIGVRQDVGRVFSSLFSYRAFVPSFRGEWGFLLATAGDVNPLDFKGIAARFKERLGPEAGLRFYAPAMHRAMCTLSQELADLIGQKIEVR